MIAVDGPGAGVDLLIVDLGLHCDHALNPAGLVLHDDLTDPTYPESSVHTDLCQVQECGMTDGMEDTVTGALQQDPLTYRDTLSAGMNTALSSDGHSVGQKGSGLEVVAEEGQEDARASLPNLGGVLVAGAAEVEGGATQRGVLVPAPAHLPLYPLRLSWVQKPSEPMDSLLTAYASADLGHGRALSLHPHAKAA